MTVSSLRGVVELRVLGVEVCRPMAGMVEEEWGRNKGGQRELTDVEDRILKHALSHCTQRQQEILEHNATTLTGRNLLSKHSARSDH